MNWRKVRGFDAAEEDYIRLDHEKWIKENRIREIGRENGKQNQPGKNDANTDETPQKILDWVNERALQCQKDVSKYLTSIASALNQEGDRRTLEDMVRECETKINDIKIELNNEQLREQQRISLVEESLKENKQHYENFRTENGLKRPANYEHRKNAWFYIASIAVIEIFLNASLLMDVVPTGLIGSFSQMFLIVAVNIVTGSLVLGTLWRVVNHKKSLYRSLAWSGVLVVFVMIVLFNLLVGHFRETLLADQKSTLHASTADEVVASGDTQEAIEAQVLDRFFADPVGFEHFRTILLVLVGLMCFVIASWKGYQSDDPYPGYGPVDRHYKHTKNKYQQKFDQIMEQLEKIFSEGKATLEDRRHDIQIRKDHYSTQLLAGKRVCNEYTQNLRQYSNDLNWLLGSYYTANVESRTKPAPEWPERKLDPKVFDKPAFDPSSEVDFSDIHNKIHLLITEVQNEYQTVRNKFKSFNNIIDGT